MKMFEAAMARDKYLAKPGGINALTMSLLQCMLLCHALVKFCSGTILVAGLSELWCDIKVLARQPCPFLGAGVGLRFSGNPGVWSQSAVSVSGLIPYRLSEY